MPKKLPYELVKSFESDMEYNEWRLEQAESWSIENSFPVNCTMCECSLDTHRMRVSYAVCNNYDCCVKGGGETTCGKKYKIQTCLENGCVRFYAYGEHTGTVFTPKIHGCSKRTREIIEHLIDNYNSKPKKIYRVILDMNSKCI